MSDSSPTSSPDFVAVRTQALDILIIEKFVRPLAAFIPRKVTPNQITMVTPVFTTLCFVVAVLAARSENKNLALLYGLLAGLFCLGSMVTDHLDGMHARDTGQSSKLGEILDHWVDSYSVTLLILALPASIGARGPLVSLAVTTGAMVYHTQLLVYRTTGKFVYPPTGGAASAVLLSLALAVVALIVRFVPAATEHHDYFVMIVLCLMTFGNVTNIRFYFQQLNKDRTLSLFFFLAYAMVSLAYHFNFVQFWVAAALWLTLSFRISGSLVLYTVTKNAHRGFEPALLGGIFLLFPVGFFFSSPVFLGLGGATLLSALIIASALFLNLKDFKKLT